MFPKKRKFGLFNWDDDFENMFEEMEEMMRELFERAEKGELEQGKPIVYGWSMRIGPDGKVVVDEFGNTGRKKQGELTDEREPITDVINEKENIVVICELPGVNKEDIKLSVNEKSVSIKVDTAERKYSKNIRLPATVDIKNVEAHYKNGVLEVRLKKIKEDEGESREVRIK